MLMRLLRLATYYFGLLSVTMMSTGIGLSSSLAQSEIEEDPIEALPAQISAIACDSYSCDGLSSESSGCQSWLNGGQSAFRRELAGNGIKFTNNLTSFYYGNTTGGIEHEFRFSGHGDYLANIDINNLGGLRDGQGGELFYNFAVRQRLSITADTQVLLPARSNIDTALVCGLRANLAF